MDKQLFIWGRGVFGQFMTPHRVKAAANIDIMDFKISKGGTGVILTNRGDVYTWGENEYGQLGHGDFNPRRAPEKVESLGQKKVTDVFLGYDYVLALGVNLPQSEYEQAAL